MHSSPPPVHLLPLFLAALLQQSSTPPQPSACSPHVAPRSSQVFGLHADLPPQRLGSPPPPHVAGAVQPPQLMRSPQPSAMGPHSSSSQVVLQFPSLEPPSGVMIGSSSWPVPLSPAVPPSGSSP